MSRYHHVDKTFHIASARCLTNNKKVNVNEAHSSWEGESGTIIVARRPYGYNKESKIFIHGAPGNYGVNPNDRVSYYQGYKRGYDRLIIENVININKDGTMLYINDIGLNDKRALWVFK